MGQGDEYKDSHSFNIGCHSDPHVHLDIRALCEKTFESRHGIIHYFFYSRMMLEEMGRPGGSHDDHNKEAIDCRS